MKLLPIRFALLATLIVAAFLAVAPVAAMEPFGAEAALHGRGGFGQEGTPAADSGTEIEPVAIWTFAVIMMLGGVGGMLYLFKKRMGGFPAHPTWKAPITVMRSKDFADDATWPEGATGDTGHGAQH